MGPGLGHAQVALIPRKVPPPQLGPEGFASLPSVLPSRVEQHRVGKSFLLLKPHPTHPRVYHKHTYSEYWHVLESSLLLFTRLPRQRLPSWCHSGACSAEPGVYPPPILLRAPPAAPVDGPMGSCDLWPWLGQWQMPAGPGCERKSRWGIYSWASLGRRCAMGSIPAQCP